MTEIEVTVTHKSANRAVAAVIITFGEEACLIRNIQLTEIDGMLRVLMPLSGENGERKPTVYLSPQLASRVEEKIISAYYLHHRPTEVFGRSVSRM